MLLTFVPSKEEETLRQPSSSILLPTGRSTLPHHVPSKCYNKYGLASVVGTTTRNKGTGGISLISVQEGIGDGECFKGMLARILVNPTTTSTPTSAHSVAPHWRNMNGGSEQSSVAGKETTKRDKQNKNNTKDPLSARLDAECTATGDCNSLYIRVILRCGCGW